MKRFSIGQKWVTSDTVYGEVIEVFDGGESGIVIITDEHGEMLDTFNGSAADFQATGEWELVDE